MTLKHHSIHFIFIAIFYIVAVGNANSDNLSSMNKLNQQDFTVNRFSSYTESYDEENSITNITTQIGTHAYLPCKVQQTGNKLISWVRLRDGHILTVDRSIFIADQRFQALKQPDKYWTLQIKYVQARDAGLYECQVSTEPKTSARVYLKVVVPRTELIGDSNRYVKAGSTVVLQCVVRGTLEAPSFILWYHGTQQVVSESDPRIKVDKRIMQNENESQNVIGSLIIKSAQKRDSGNYTCTPSNSASVTVTLNILNDESTASAVTSSASQITFDIVLGFLFSIIIVLIT